MNADIGVIGLAVMGANLARNIASRGFKCAVYNRTYEKTTDLIDKHGDEGLMGTKTTEEFVNSLAKPRKIILMVKAGQPVDAVIESLMPLLEPDDVLIDGGNSFYKDTVRRQERLQNQGVHYVGMGVSGGEEGALKGPSIMPGGSVHSWNLLQPILEAIAAKDFHGAPCVTHVGQKGAGHFVKMVHNGIEYAIMQMLAEIYDYMRKAQGKNAAQIAMWFESVQEGPLKSYLVDIVIPVLKQEDPETGNKLIDEILDKAAQKGTGAWTSIDALERGIPVPSIATAVMARALSSQKDQRIKLASEYGLGVDISDKVLNLEKALYLGMILAYVQGLHLIAAASKEEGWSVNLSEVCRIWEGGCIIRSKLLTMFTEIFKEEPQLELILHSDKLRDLIRTDLPELKKMVAAAYEANIPIPALSSALDYLLSYISRDLPANLIQGLRDYFGAHTYERKDKEGSFHTNWSN